MTNTRFLIVGKAYDARNRHLMVISKADRGGLFDLFFLSCMSGSWSLQRRVAAGGDGLCQG